MSVWKKTFANQSGEGLATGVSLGNRLGNSSAHPMVIVSPTVSIGARECHPTASILPSGRAAEGGDPTAHSRPGGNAVGDLTACRRAGGREEDSDPTARRKGDSAAGNRTVCRRAGGNTQDSNPTARREDGSEDADPTARRYAGGRAVRHANGCAEDADRAESADPTVSTRPGVHSLDPTAEELPSVSLIDKLISVNPTADTLPSGDQEGDLMTCCRRERVPPNWMQDYVTGE
ncbi:hypothetical protein OIU79_029587 [Salix purpurea]|uniref:Uncharacterized protein n=1 Tax=Salix purpurea TaxID=77065 RepID=A0A9Q0VHF9_SALPP|nr:hypothetical protein OIU79_029587 [Salix purpurea]